MSPIFLSTIAGLRSHSLLPLVILKLFLEAQERKCSTSLATNYFVRPKLQAMKTGEVFPSLHQEPVLLSKLEASELSRLGPTVPSQEWQGIHLGEPMGCRHSHHLNPVTLPGVTRSPLLPSRSQQESSTSGTAIPKVLALCAKFLRLWPVAAAP